MRTLDWQFIVSLLFVGAVAAGCATNDADAPEDPVAARLLELEKAARDSPDDARAQYTLGNAYFDARRLDDAREAYSRSIACDSRFADAYTNLGLVYRMQGAPDAAVDQYEKALAIQPGDETTLRNLIIVLESMGRGDEALSRLAELSRLRPKDTELLNRLASRYMHSERYTEARDAYATLATERPNDANAWLELGRCHAALEAWSEAIEAWRMASSLDPDSGPARAGLVEAYYRTGDYERAWLAVRESQQVGGYLDPALITRLQDDSGRLGPD